METKEYPPTSMQIKDMQGKLFSQIGEELRPIWRDFANSFEENRFQLKAMELEEIAQSVHKPGRWNCAQELLLRLDRRGLQIRHLIKNLRRLHVYGALQYLVPPEPLQILKWSDSITVEEGEKIRLTCQATGIPPPVYTWFQGQTLLRPESRETAFIIDSAQKQHEGSYICGVRLEGTSMEMQWTQRIQVDVRKARPRVAVLHQDLPSTEYVQPPPPPPLRAPEIVEQTGTGTGKEVALEYGGALELVCHARGHPTPDFQWLKDDMLLHGCNEPVLRIPKVHGHDSGKYHCCVSNSQGTAYSYKVKVNIMRGKVDKLVIQEHPSDISVERNGNICFKVKAEGRNLAYQWYKDGTRVPGATQSMYWILGVTNDHRGSYMCKVSIRDDAGTVLDDQFSQPAKLTVTTPYDKPVQVTGKIALVIGVSPEKGPDPKLMCVINDCIVVTQKLRELDFKVMSFYDLTKREMKIAVSTFASLLGPDMYAVVYLAGHGRYSGGQHYFAPVDPREGSYLEDDYCCEEMQKELLECKPKLLAMFLDMCRGKHTGPKKDEEEAEHFEREEEGNLIVFYATLPYREAFEPTVTGDQQRELLMPLLHPDHHSILCKLLGQTMHRDVYLTQLFQDIQDEMLASADWEKMKKRGTPQIPSLLNNLLDWRVRLTDPLRGHHPNMDKWEKFGAVQSPVLIQVEGLKITVSFRELLSTVLEVTIRPSTHYQIRDRMRVTLDRAMLPPALLMEQREDHMGGKLSGSTAIISRLHKHCGVLTLVVKVEMDHPRYQPKRYKIDLNDVLITFFSRNFQCEELEHRACEGLGGMEGLTLGGGAAEGGDGGLRGQEHDEMFSRRGGAERGVERGAEKGKEREETQTKVVYYDV